MKVLFMVLFFFVDWLEKRNSRDVTHLK
jgi:hypothetical protein